MEEIGFKHRLNTKIILSFLFIIFLTAGILFGLMYSQSYHLIVNDLGEKALEIGQVCAKNINVEEIKNFKTLEDQNKPIYKRIVKDLDHIGEIAGAKYIYIIRLNENNEYVYVVDAKGSNKEPIGTEVDEYPGFRQALEGKA